MSTFLTPVTRTTLTEDVCSKLTGHLVRGDWQEGDRLPSERELCKSLGVGRASLREAMKALELMGIIESRVGEGTFVCGRSDFLARPLLWSIAGSDETQVKELIEARRLMERELAMLAAERAQEKDLQKIEQLLNRMTQSVDKREAYLIADLDFHLAIAQAAYNRPLLNAVQLIRNVMRQWIEESLQVAGTSSNALVQHKRIFEMISKKDSNAARQAMEEHLDAMADVLLKVRAARNSNLRGERVS
jgi:GntR family transcriptional regulator, transcriptional repressor for pyruvate dehydrogenase complex